MKLTDCEMTKPFTHPDMIGAYCIINGRNWVHRDNVNDFNDDDLIEARCLGSYGLWGICADDLLRNDWFNVEYDK